MERRKKLLILVDWFSPGYKAGGPIRSCVNICTALNLEYDIYVLTSDTDHGEREPYQGIVADKWLLNEQMGIHIFYARQKQISAQQIAQQIAFVDADFVYLNHLFSPWFVIYPLWLKFRGQIKTKVIVAPRGALYDSALSLKKYKKQPLLILYKWLGIQNKVLFHATNTREQQAIEQYFKGSKTIVADNLPATKQPVFQHCFKEAGKLQCIFIARVVPIKNLLYLLQILQQLPQQICLTIVGPVEDELYWQACVKCIAVMPDNIKVNYIGPKKNEELAQLIQQHHLFILPTTGENFGHSIFEALLNGRPVLISDQTPWLQLEAQHTGWDLPLNSPDLFGEILSRVALYNQDEFNKYALGAWQYAHQFINNPAAKEQYFQLFK